MGSPGRARRRCGHLALRCCPECVALFSMSSGAFCLFDVRGQRTFPRGARERHAGGRSLSQPLQSATSAQKQTHTRVNKRAQLCSSKTSLTTPGSRWHLAHRPLFAHPLCYTHTSERRRKGKSPHRVMWAFGSSARAGP